MMIKILKSDGGNIALAMLLAVIGMMSGLSISSMGLRDTIASQAELESIQGLHLLRAETFRGQSFLETAARIDPGLGGGLRTPMRSVPITGSHFAKTYTMQSQITRKSVESEGLAVEVGGESISASTGAGENEYLVRSLIETKTGVGQVAYFSNNKSQVRKYSELSVFQNTGPIFMYFSDNEASPNDTNVYFYGYDVINGPLHSNTDIQMKKLGGGNNQGWPTFLSTVTTCGEVISDPAQYPRDTVFRGGLIEHYSHYEYPTQMLEVRRNGHIIGPSNYDSNRIVMVKGVSSGYSGRIGTVEAPRRVFADVWPNTYPYNPYGVDTPPAYRNNFTVSDTTWAILPGGTSAKYSNFVNSKLWIEGIFQGFQTWGAADTLYLIGDILLQGTPEGTDPASNTHSMVGLISEKSILIKYGYMNPADSTRVHSNMGPDSEWPDPAGGGIWIYAALAALGDGNGNSHYDGVFTFEYQHPHGSTPAQLLDLPNDEEGPIVIDWIDLHRNRWPQTPSNPWPAWLDLPWYNPLWPERNPYLERGTINIWGGVNQRRRGFVHRNFYDNEWPSGGVWNVPNDFCGATSAPNAFPVQLWWNPNYSENLQTRHYPGAVGSGTGYKKNYNYDVRMYKKKPPDWPEFKKQGQKMPMEQGNWLLKRPPRALI